MKLTQKSVEAEETVCEITQHEFDRMCASTASEVVRNILPDEPGPDDLEFMLFLTTVLAKFVHTLDKQLFTEPDTHDKKEEK